MMKIPYIVPELSGVAFERTAIGYESERRVHIVIDGEPRLAREAALHAALVCHYPNYERDKSLRTRITMLMSPDDADDMMFEFAELFDNSFRRIVDLRGDTLRTETRRPIYDGQRHDFVDIEWEFVYGRMSHPVFRRKMGLWSKDERQDLCVILCHDDAEYSKTLQKKLLQRLGPNVRVLTVAKDTPQDCTELLGMAKYLNYFYTASYGMRHVPTELPESAVEEAWKGVESPVMQLSNIYNVLTMPVKMRTLGHGSDDLDTFYALTADEIERLTAVEHNRWSVERLIQGMRPCTDAERAEIEANMSLKKKYKNERGAHYDLVAFDSLGNDDTGLPVSRYDRDLTAAIPLIVKTYYERHNG